MAVGADDRFDGDHTLEVLLDRLNPPHAVRFAQLLQLVLQRWTLWIGPGCHPIGTRSGVPSLSASTSEPMKDCSPQATRVPSPRPSCYTSSSLDEPNAELAAVSVLYHWLHWKRRGLAPSMMCNRIRPALDLGASGRHQFVATQMAD